MKKICLSKNSQLFLAGDLSPGEEKNFIDHLSECTHCQGHLQTLAGDKDTWEMAHKMLEFEPENERSSQTELLIPTTSPRANLDADGNERAEASAIISLLHPSDDPRMMGRIGNYEIIGLVGRGGMGIVFKAFDRSLNRNVAVKVLEPSLSHVGAARQRFAREAQTMASITHENVIPIFAVSEHAGLPYFVMEYADGGTLEQRLTEEGAFPFIDVMQIGLQVSKALYAAHRQGLVHRDIKPGNVLMYRGTSRVRVADFGLVQVASEASFTRSGMLAGTPAFMSPEQIRGEICDHRSDLFSLGSMLYTLCVGHAPFRADTVYGVMQRIVNDTPRAITQQKNTTPIWLERLIQKLMAKPREKRFYDAATVAGILEREIAHHQNPGSIREPDRKWFDQPVSPQRTNRVLQALVAVLSLSLILGATAVVVREYFFTKAPEAKQVKSSESISSTPTELPGWSDQEISDARTKAQHLWSQIQPAERGWNRDSYGDQVRSIQLQATFLLLDYENDLIEETPEEVRK